ncbi:hypothetical protein WHR41_04261 [Cladosporium halotolerans]|uniref:Rhodopsin domain-containing protein n=1 Tax=Cladosporium halotolerans TaxID=1052096 RepID=A0AB34KVH3_9PEZI
MERDESIPPLVVTSVAIVGIIWVVMVLSIRLYIRVRLNGPVSKDDYAAILATALGIAQSALVLAAVHTGLGRPVDIQNLTDQQTTTKIGYAATLLYVSATYVSRASSCFLYIRLTAMRFHVFVAFLALSMSAVAGLVCLFVIAFQCKMPNPWDAPHGRRCINTWHLWRAVEITAIALEAFIFSISVLLVWSLRMRRRLKAMVVFAFSVRLLIVIPIALRLEFIHHAHTSSNSIYTNVAVTILTTITTHLATMSSTLPCLKQFLAMFDSGMIGEYTDATYTGSGKGTRTDQSIALASLASSTGARVGKRRRGSDELRLRPDQSTGDTGAEITVENSSTISEQSNSGIIKETRRWEVSYERW